MITKLLHIANSAPDAVDRRRFYAMKDRILRCYGEPDGWDIQYIAGKLCYGCDGTGIWSIGWSPEKELCARCDGTGWWKRPRWVTLNRYRFGRYTFHIPGETYYKRPHDSLIDGAKQRFDGYLQHQDRGTRSPRLACAILGLFFDLRLTEKAIGVTALRAALRRRCAKCQRQMWFDRRLLCQKCLDGLRSDDDQYPF